MKLTPKTITEHHVIECNSEEQQIATFETLIKMGWKVDEEDSYFDGKLSFTHNLFPHIRWGSISFLSCPSLSNLKKIDKKPLIPITLNDLADLNETKMYNKKQTIAQQLSITEFPFEIKNKQGKVIYHEASYGDWWKREYNSKGKDIYFENSDGYWRKSEYNNEGKEVYYENSDGKIEDKRPKPCEDKTITIEGVEEGFELNDKDYIYCGCYEVVESIANWLGKKGFKVNGCTIVGSTSGFDCLEYNVNEGWSISQKMSCINNGRQIHIEHLERVKPKRELPEINGYKGKIQGDEIVYNNCARLLIDWFKGSENRIISNMQLNTGVWITEKKIEQISNYLKQENLI